MELNLSHNLVRSVPGELFKNLIDLEILFMSENYITELSTNVFLSLGKLKELYLSYNLISSLLDGLFQNMTNLKLLYLDGNLIAKLDVGLFSSTNRLKNLYLNDNLLTSLPDRLFENLTILQTLALQNNKLIRLQSEIFSDLKNMTNLDISNNSLTSFPKNIFHGLINLRVLLVNLNRLKTIDRSQFHRLNNLYVLRLDNNYLTHVDADLFRDTAKLAFIGLSFNQLQEIPIIKNLMNLKVLVVLGNPLTMISHGSFSSLSKNLEIFVNQTEICECYMQSPIKCSSSSKYRSPYVTCGRLLPDRALVVLMWIIGFNALFGNLFVLIWRRQESRVGRASRLLVNNLAAANFLMGIYVVMIASADVYYGKYYPMQAEIWRYGITCRIAGSLVIISSEASVFFVTLISIDRFTCIQFINSVKKWGWKSALILSVIIWVISFLLGIIPSILSGMSGVSFKFYDNSHMCVGLPLTLTKLYSSTAVKRQLTYDQSQLESVTYTHELTSHANGRFFSTAIFLGLNSVCCLMIAGCCIGIVRAVRKSTKETGRNMTEQIRLATKVLAIVVTDFCCWFVLIILGVLVQTRGITLSASALAWCATFVLSINSAINPYLYTIPEVISNYKKKEDESQKLQMSVK